MPKRVISFRGIVLRIEPQGENYRSVHTLSPDVGTTRSLQRLSSRKTTANQIDLFDEGRFSLQTDSNPHTGFITEFELQHRRTQLSKHYESLCSASEFARILSLNSAHLENQSEVFSLFKRALDAWEKGHAPQATLFKCLYLYCRDEGYPIKEEWITRLSQHDRKIATELINTPLANISIAALEMTELLTRLTDYYRNQTHIRV